MPPDFNSKQQVDYYTNLPGYTREVKYTLRGTIYYNPNTFVVSAVSNTTVLNVSPSIGTLKDTTTSHSKGAYSGTFNASVVISHLVTSGDMPITTIEFAPAVGTLVLDAG